MIEEFMLDWRDWARAVIGLPVEWPDFYIANGVVVVLGIVAADLAAPAPGIALSFAGLMLVNAVLFHIAPFIWTRGRFSPGLFTALLLLIPIGAGCYSAAPEIRRADARAHRRLAHARRGPHGHPGHPPSDQGPPR